MARKAAKKKPEPKVISIPSSMKRLFSSKQVRALLGGLTPEQFRRLINRGEFPPRDVAMGPKLFLWTPETVDLWLEEYGDDIAYFKRRRKTREDRPHPPRLLPTPEERESLLTREQVGLLLGMNGVTKDKLKRLLAKGRFPPPDALLGGRLPRWTVAFVGRWIEEYISALKSVARPVDPQA